MPKTLVPAKKRPVPTRPTRGGSSGTDAKKSKIRTKAAAGAKNAGKPPNKKALGGKTDKAKKTAAPKKDLKDKPKKSVVKKLVTKVTAKKAVVGKCKKKLPTKKVERAEKIEKSASKKDKDEASGGKEPVEVVIHVKKPKLKAAAKKEPKAEVVSGKIKKIKTTKPSQMKKEILKKLSSKMDGKLESVVNTILEVAVVKKVHSKAKPTMEDTNKDKDKKKKEVAKKKGKESKQDSKKTGIKGDLVNPVDIPDPEKGIVKELTDVSKTAEKKSDSKFQLKPFVDEDIRRMEIKKEIIDEFIEEEEKQSQVRLERKKLPFLKKPPAKPKEEDKRAVDGSEGAKESHKGKGYGDEWDGEDFEKKEVVAKPMPSSSDSEKSSKKEEALVKKNPKAKSNKGKKPLKTDKTEDDEKTVRNAEADDNTDEEQKAKRMKLYGFWNGPKRHRVASLNAIAKVHCLYENESRGAMMEMLDKQTMRSKIDRKKFPKDAGQKKSGRDSEDEEKTDDSVPEVPKRSLRTAPGMRGVGRHYDIETSSSSPPSSSSSDAETEDERPERRPPLPKSEVKNSKPTSKSKGKEKPEEKEKPIEESEKEEPAKKVRKRRRRCELMMDLKDMVVRKRMASLNASAMLAATYSVEKKTTKSDDDKRKKCAQSTTTDSTQSSTEVEPESSDEEVILSGSSKKVAVIVNQDTDVTITGLYVNSTTRSTRHCSITGMQYRISSTSHTQTESTAVTTETVIHTTDHVSVSHSSSSSVEAVGSPGGSCKSYTPLGALSSMQPPGNASPLMRRHPCSTSAFSAPPPYHHHEDMHGYYQPAGPLISHHYHAASSSSSSLPAVSAPPVSSKGSPGPEQTSRPGDPPAEPPPLQEYRPPPFTSAGYPPPPHHNYYPYIQPYQECYNPYLKYPAHPGFRRGFWPGHAPPPPGPGSSTSGAQMVTSDPYHGPPPGPGGPIEPYPHPVAQPPPQPYYYPHTAPPPTCYSHPAPLRAPIFMPDAYQTCPCPSMSTFPKNVHTGPLTGASKGSVQAQAQNSQSQQAGNSLTSEQTTQQVQQQLSVPAATQPASSMPNVALALSLETNNPHHGPPSPARGSAGMPPPASPALSTARNPPSWSPPNIIQNEPTKELKTREEIRPAEPSPPPPQTLVVEGPPVLENQVVAAQRRPRPPKRKPSIERQVSPSPPELDDKPVLEPAVEVVPKRRRSVTPVRSKSEPTKQIGTRGAQKKPSVDNTNAEKKPKPSESQPPKMVLNGVAKTPKIMDGAKKLNGLHPTPTLKNGVKSSSRTSQTGAIAQQKMLLKNTTKTQSPPLTPRPPTKCKKENCKTKGTKPEPKRPGKRAKDALALGNPMKTHPNGLKWSNGWSWEGEGYKARVFLAGDESPVYRICYPAMRHIEGDIIYPMDCILLKSGPRKQQLPFIAKVASLWENPDDGEMMISLLWYYRPEHTDQGRQPLQPEDEVFASRHRDTNSVACIEDKCYVLTYNEYCRYKKSLSAADFGVSMDKRRVVPAADYYPRSRRLPTGRIANELLFFCRKVYDFRTKRLLKKPY